MPRDPVLENSANIKGSKIAGENFTVYLPGHSPREGLRINIQLPHFQNSSARAASRLPPASPPQNSQAPHCFPVQHNIPEIDLAID